MDRPEASMGLKAGRSLAIASQSTTTSGLPGLGGLAAHFIPLALVRFRKNIMSCKPGGARSLDGSEGRKKFGNRFSIHDYQWLAWPWWACSSFYPPARRFSRNEREKRNLTKALRVQKRMSVSQDGVLAYTLPLSSDQLERRLAIVPNSYFTDAQQRFEKQRITASPAAEIPLISTWTGCRKRPKSILRSRLGS